ncbi:hypothetical protein BDY17DRAFT_295127 [Neohortaea acidophila]|uniref:N-acetylgalactosaminide beta-1,3-galactosyltransferase n=1 Tax=Neohortaea acidophila TaxID=245834 RepID=A0A6A6PWQ1_9PEZI|nr:uncharacterized protein BDY17DRAFT_295127 [Neohortaea acidophila]KAF2484164.1 hypothetical protein BDY17DRAFT_295127 [Neohortaea acidophila]
MLGTRGVRRLLRVGLLTLIATCIFLALRVWTAREPPSLWEQASLAPPTITHDWSPDGRAQSFRTPEAAHRAPKLTRASYCDAVNISNIVVITKTGAIEAKAKLPPQLSTCLSCVPDPLIFSDLDQTLGTYQIHDVLSRVGGEGTYRNEDFDLYYQQKDLASRGREADIPALASLPIASPDWRTIGKSAGWGLDKYKFLHMIDRAWEYQPDKDWYVFIETDTYLSLPNLAAFLATQDPTERWYFGNAVRMYERDIVFHFAHGGSGFILSGATVRDFAVTHKGLAVKHDWRFRVAWFGDYVLANTFDEVLKLQVTNLLPMLQSDNPANVPFAADTWCKPVITLHYIDAAHFQQLFDFEKARDFAGFMYKNLYPLVFPSGAPPTWMEMWDNGSDNDAYAIVPTSDSETKIVRDRHNSFTACKTACREVEECLQFSFHSAKAKRSECFMSKSIRLGKKFVDMEAEGAVVHSGWVGERVGQWVEGHAECPA